MGSRFRSLLVIAGAMAAAFTTPMQERVSAQRGTLPTIIISEFRMSGPLTPIGAQTPNNEFFELFNASSQPVNIGGWTLQSSNNVLGNTPFVRATIPANTIMNPGCYYLLGNSNTGGYTGTGTARADLNYTVGFADDGGAALVNSTLPLLNPPDQTKIVDQVGLGVNSAFGEGARLVPVAATTESRSYQRNADEVFGFRDEDNNLTDFSLAPVPATSPKNSTAACVTLKTYLPYEIQGAGSASPLAAGTPVLVRGVVTARTANGFFIQTESGFEDANPDTSEGLFIASTHNVTVGHLVNVVGKVSENGSLTQVNNVTIVGDLGTASVAPPSHILTLNDLSATGALGQLEKFEGMIVSATQLSAVSGTDSNGAFHVVLTGQPRPFREPGVRANLPVLPCASGPCNIPVFDGNPELLRIDSNGLLGTSPVDVSTGALLNGVVGPLGVDAGAYTLLPAPFVANGGMSIVAAPPAAADQFTVASVNLGAFFAARQAKASLAVRDALHFPDVIGVQGVNTVGELLDLAAQVNLDAAGAVQYQPYPSSGGAADPLGVGFLVRLDRASSVSAEFVTTTPTAFAHPPLVLHATLTGPATRLPQVLTVVNSEFAPLAGVELADPAVRNTRHAQANELADYLQGRQIADPNEALVALGNYNAFDFNDGYVDVVGAVRGVPTPADQVVLASLPVVAPPLANPDMLNAWSEQYSSISNGSAQSLDHVLVSANAAGQVSTLAHVRVNADFPEVFGSDPTTPARFSDRDPLVAYFTFKPDLDAPVFDAVQDVTVEALSANGEVVTFNTPAAHDNLDASVTVSCAPASGSVFPLGNTAVTCSTQDLAGNASSTSFTVRVQDTTAPAVTVPSNLVAEAASAAGSTVTFSASATDAVTAPLAVVCSPLSGSVFPLGTTPVTCSARDAANNMGSASFNVTVQDTTAPVVSGPATVTAEATSAAGAVVTFASTAADAVTASLNVVCSPLASGATFPLGTTSVSCSAQDAAGNTGSASFNVTVRDTTAPVVTAPASVTAEAASAAGRAVSFSATATDAVTTVLNVTCSPVSGGVFPLGTTNVSCSAQDGAGNTGSAAFTVTVRDTTAPALVVPSNITAQATSSSGGVVTFTASATDAVTASPAVTCAPASGSTFPVGTTTVTCSAQDAANNTANGSFTVTLTAPASTTVDGRMSGDGEVRNGNRRVDFDFDVKDANGVEQGWVTMVFRSGGTPQRFVSSRIDEVTFSSRYGAYVETVVVRGVGCVNGACNVRFEFTAFDGDGPGRDGRDYFEGKLFNSRGQVINFVTGEVRSGEIQVDQSYLKTLARRWAQRHPRRR